MITIKKVETNKDLTDFIDVPHYIHQDAPNYVPELYLSQKDMLNRKKNPFFKHSEAEYFLAIQNNEIVGRIAAIQNNNYNAFSGEKAGFFGFFDCINNQEVADKLFDTVKNWLKKYNPTILYGPTNFSTNDTCGVLVDGFDTPSYIMSPYNHAYYKELIENAGFVKKTDLWSYLISATNNEMVSKLLKTLQKVEERLANNNIIFRTINMQDFKNDLLKIRSVYNSAWKDNWGFFPMTEDEFYKLGEDLKMIAPPEYIIIAEHNNVPIAFSATVPNLNEVVIKTKKGRLFPLGFLHLINFKKKIKSVRLITMGVIEEYRKMGVDACMYAKTAEAVLKNNIEVSEVSWILENNTMMNAIIKKFNANQHKTHRLYEYKIDVDKKLEQ